MDAYEYGTLVEWC